MIDSLILEEGMTSKTEPVEGSGLIWIGIQGGTCAGKSTLACELAARLGSENTAIICLDSFFKPYDRKANAENVTAYNFDHPSSLDWLALEAAARSLRSGRPTRIAEFDYETGFLLEGQMVVPRKYIIIEGLWPFFYQPLIELLSFRVFVDTPADVRLARLLLRNIIGGARGWSIQSVLEYYLECVRPMQIEYIDKGKELADILVNGEDSLAHSVEQIIQALEK
jgi:uridine kinase